MTEHDPTKFYEPHKTEWQVQHMTEEFEVWNTIETYQDKESAESHAKDYAEANPEVEIQIVRTVEANY